MAGAFKACAVKGCNLNAHYAAGGAKGWCRAHYRRNYRYNDPVAGQTYKGEPLRWLAENIGRPSEGCLIWPFARDGAGYAQINIRGRVHYVSRIVCRLAHGEPATRQMLAAHSCGKGATGCISPIHLRWATPTENAADKSIHGTLPLGEKHHAARLTTGDVKEIRRLRGLLTQREIGVLFGVGEDAVGSIHRGENWAWLA